MEFNNLSQDEVNEINQYEKEIYQQLEIFKSYYSDLDIDILVAQKLLGYISGKNLKAFDEYRQFMEDVADRCREKKCDLEQAGTEYKKAQDKYDAWINAFLRKKSELSILNELKLKNLHKEEKFSSKFPRLTEIDFFITHPIIGIEIGLYSKGATNISTNSIRFATQGKGEFILNPKFHAIFEDRGSEVNAFRHTLWISTIASRFGDEAAQHAGNAHEDLSGNAHESKYKNIDLTQRYFNDRDMADRTVDFLNNQIARELGANSGSKSMKQLSLNALEHFHKEGLYVFTNYEIKMDGQYSAEIGKRKITDEQYNYMSNLFNQLDDNGKLPEGYTLDKTGKIVLEK